MEVRVQAATGGGGGLGLRTFQNVPRTELPQAPEEVRIAGRTCEEVLSAGEEMRNWGKSGPIKRLQKCVYLS